MGTLWPEEPRLIAGWSAHDPAALDALIRDHARDLLAVITQILHGIGSVQGTKACVNALFVGIWQEITTFDPTRSSLRTWITIRAKTIALARRRSLRGYPG
jgi:RNA polymerase sigma-70 factor (ECF subfamily)